MTNPLDLTNEDFSELVDRALRWRQDEGRTPEEDACLQQLTSPEIVQRTRSTLLGMKKSVESQMASRKAEHVQSMMLHSIQDPKFKRDESKYQQWRAAALRFRSSVEDWLTELKWVEGDSGRLRKAIIAHRDHQCGPECDDQCAADQELWGLVSQT